MTPLIPAGGTRGFLLTDVIKTSLPMGILKVTVEGESPTAASFFQFSGDSATSLQTVHDLVPVALSRSGRLR
jgi:hypothetical protein